MGAQQSVQLSCTVIDDKLTHHKPGETVQGTVFLKVQGTDLTKFEGIEITLAGVECLQNTPDIVVGTKKIKIEKDIVTFANDGILPEGEYEYPFQLTLPTTTTTTMTDEQIIPVLTHSRSNSENTVSSSSSGSSSSDLDLATKEYCNENMPSPTIMYQLRASLKRKKGVSLTVDTDYRCHA